MDALILGVRFALVPASREAVLEVMDTHRRDREAKGHYRYPSAGSAFKNNRDFGSPTGKILDELGLRGFAIGDAQIAPWHGNILINRGNATARDIRVLVDEVIRKVRTERGFSLEPEILFVGNW
jgi:UDP-N-acetylmuramate dehydrogenase